MSEKFQITAKTLFGMEKVLADELRALGAERIRPGRRLVDFWGDQKLLYKANLWCRTAIRVLKPISTFQAEDERGLYDGIQAIDWSQYLDRDGSLTIDPVVFSSFTTHSLYAAQLSKDAIVDQFRERFGERPSVDRDDPDLRINLYLNQNRATVYLDSSGDSLHKRGYRTATNQAPINEVLAAGILRMIDWNGTVPLADFMCGSGTFPIEAALIARNIAPGLIRKELAYLWWKDFDQVLHEQLLEEARASVREASASPISGSDLDPDVVQVAIANAKNAGVADSIEFSMKHFEDAVPCGPSGVLVTNPPYDERLKVNHVAAVFRRVGEAIRRNWIGHSAYMLLGNPAATKAIGLRPSRRTRLYNGPIECELLRFDVLAPQPARTRLTRFAQEAPALPPAAGLPTADGPIAPAPDTSSSSTADPAQLDLDELEEVHGYEVEETEQSAAAARGSRRSKEEQAAEFRNRLTRMGKHWGRWARRQSISCYRIYDRDIPEIPLAIDWYDGHLHIAEYERPNDRTELEHHSWLAFMAQTAADALGVHPDRVFLKHRRRQRGEAQYERQAVEGNYLHVVEGGHKFRVNLADYLDTGLFLDHRITRSMVEKEAKDKRVLNLFAYTGAFSVYAAAGGALSTTTVDMSNTYVDWARENMRINGFTQVWHQFVRAEAMSFVRNLRERIGPPFDLIVIDPPTFSNSKRTLGIWDVQRDHVEILNLLIEHLPVRGKIYFSTNFRKFKLAEGELLGVAIREISAQTVPPDFRNKRIHRCWTLVKQ